jgi:hypothetical protein
VRDEGTGGGERRFGWKHQVARPVFWLVRLVTPTVKRLLEAVERWMWR